VSGWLIASLLGLAVLFVVMLAPVIHAIHVQMRDEAREDRDTWT
jgi:hypothetical protein